MPAGSGRKVVQIPDGLTELLQDFTVAVLKEQPDDLVEFSCDYFNQLQGQKRKERGVAFDGEVSSSALKVKFSIWSGPCRGNPVPLGSL